MYSGTAGQEAGSLFLPKHVTLVTRVIQLCFLVAILKNSFYRCLNVLCLSCEVYFSFFFLHVCVI